MKYSFYISYCYSGFDGLTGFGGYDLKSRNSKLSVKDLKDFIAEIKKRNPNFKDCVILSISEIRSDESEEI